VNTNKKLQLYGASSKTIGPRPRYRLAMLGPPANPGSVPETNRTYDYIHQISLHLAFSRATPNSPLYVNDTHDYSHQRTSPIM